MPYGAPPDWVEPTPLDDRGIGPARVALLRLREASRTRAFWLLAGGFFVCGWSTNGLVGTHFIPAAHDHGLPTTTGAGLLAVIGVFDLVGTIGSGWLTDRYDPRILLLVYYALRGVSLLLVHLLWAPTVQPPMFFFVVLYGLDWVATVPPTVALCRECFGARARRRGLRLGVRLAHDRAPGSRPGSPASSARRRAATTSPGGSPACSAWSPRSRAPWSPAATSWRRRRATPIPRSRPAEPSMCAEAPEERRVRQIDGGSGCGRHELALVRAATSSTPRRRESSTTVTTALVETAMTAATMTGMSTAMTAKVSQQHLRRRA